MRAQTESRLRTIVLARVQVIGLRADLERNAGAAIDTSRPACFIAPGLLVALDLSASSAEGDEPLTRAVSPGDFAQLTYEGVRGGKEFREVKACWIDERTGLAILAVSQSATDERLAGLTILAEDPPASGADWQAWTTHEGFPGRAVTGVVDGGHRSSASGARPLEQLRLRLDAPNVEPAALRGAPVFSEDRLIGIITEQEPRGNLCYAIPGAAIQRIREAMPAVEPAGAGGWAPGSWAGGASKASPGEDESPDASTVFNSGAARARGRARAQVNADNPDGDDLLDVQNEVDAISSVIAAHDTEPPMSIGLFGDWGTGKSFFMSRMEKKVRDLMAVARSRPGSAYCSNIVQLRFNAWHYMDTDLWASLAAEIFEGLARELDRDRGLLDGDEDPAVARARLLAATSHLRALQSDAEQRKVEADAALRASTERLSNLAQDERAIEAGLKPRELLKAAYRFVAAQPGTARSLEQAAEKMGIPQAQALASDTRAKLLELHGLWGGIKATWLALRKGQARLWILLALCVLFLLVLLGALVSVRDRLAPVLIPAVALLSTALVLIGRVVPPVREALRIISDARKRNDALIQDAQERRAAELRQAHDAIQQRVTAEETAIARVTQEVAELERQLEMLRADAQMGAYIRSRSQSTDYTKHFGVIARARHDFEQLTELLRRVRAEETQRRSEPANGKTRPPRIDRIILYIDDLDRCPESKVVDVLQAVHLLMALPLFVVVVAVDSRWLLHSLRQEATVFRSSGEVIEGLDDEERFHWESTPFNYLEKIFQIPFNLRPIDESGFVRLIDNLTLPQSGTSRVASSTDRPGGAPEPASPASNLNSALSNVTGTPVSIEITQRIEAQSTPVPTQDHPDSAPGEVGSDPVQAKEGAPNIDPNPPFLDLTAAERTFMHGMHRLIPTPRAAKRYVNVYRLLRASLPDRLRAKLEDEGGERSHYVLLMLAILTGFPQEGAVILRELVERKPAGDWWDFVDALAAETIGAPGDNPQRAQRWRELRQRLTTVRGQLNSSLAEQAPCAAFAEWARLVARYSFESGRVLTTVASSQPPPFPAQQAL